MMKRINRNQDGYILVYVLVVVLVVSLVAVAACTTAMKNHDAQVAAVNYTRDKYETEGVMELFMLELQNAAVNYAKELPSDITAGALDTQVTNEIIGQDSEDSAETSAFAIIRKNGYNPDEYVITVEDRNDDEPSKFNAKFELAADDDSKLDQFKGLELCEEEDAKEKGYAYYDIAVKCVHQGVEVEAEIRLSFPVKKGGGYATVYGVLFEYLSYNVSRTPATTDGGGAE